MKVMLIHPAGFCPGVRRAFELVEDALRKASGSVYLLGDLVHNRQAIEELKKKGVQLTENPEALPCHAIVVTRSHGVDRETLQVLQERCVTVVDTTCPRVRRVRDLAQSLEKDGFRIVVLGNPQHPEIQSLLSFLEQKALVFGKEEEWKNFDFSPWEGEKIAVLAQTTFPQVLFEAFLEWKRREWPQLDTKIFNTLCSETETRQMNLVKAIRENALTTVVVVGGRQSSNTASLVLLAREAGVKTIWIEEPGELHSDLFSPGEKVGLASGASTPDWLVHEVLHWLQSLECSSSRM